MNDGDNELIVFWQKETSLLYRNHIAARRADSMVASGYQQIYKDLHKHITRKKADQEWMERRVEALPPDGS